MKRVPLGCGIVGTYNVPTEDHVFDQMTDSLVHRGPNGRGTWTSPDGKAQLGHRRLSILDISEQGSQPMIRSYPDGRTLTVTFNGEIYNYPQLKQELKAKSYTFVSTSDTEVLLHGYHCWGVDFVKRLNGIFAFGLYDTQRDQLLLARDHIGVKPMLYAEVGSGILFASESKALLKHPLIQPQANFYTIRQDMIHGFWGDKAESWFEGIHQLPPGSMMVWNPQGRQIRSYWHLQPNEPDLLEVAKAQEMFRSLALEAVRMQLMSDVGFCTTNSGGLDSSTITAMISQILKENGSGEQLQALTIEYDDAYLVDQLPFNPEFTGGFPRRLVDLWHARQMAKELGNVNLTGIKVPQAQFTQENVDMLVRTMDAIPMDLRFISIHNLYHTIQEMGQRVVLIGEGPDEIWMGYYYDDDFWRFPPEHQTIEYLSGTFYPGRITFGAQAWNENFLSPAIAAQLSRQNLERNLKPFQTRDLMNNLTYFAWSTMLQSVLNFEDRLSMVNSVEARVPWLDYRLVELSFRIPSQVKIVAPDDNKAKYFMRQALQGVTPDLIRNRRKSPFPHPPDEYKDQLIGGLIAPNAERIKKSPFMNELFRKEFLTTIEHNEKLSSIELFRFFSLWRFSELYNL